MGVEGRDLIDLGQRELHLLRQRGKMRGGEMAVVILDEVQMLDEQIAPARPVGEQRKHFLERFRIDLTALRGARRAAPPGSPAVVGRQCRRRLGQAHCVLFRAQKCQLEQS